MVKKKTVWYVLVRALREKMKGLRNRIGRNSEGIDLARHLAIAAITLRPNTY